eukprot:TRINITY_DN72073_c0_g1_i1.p9 TRINITY_DN72073_c0_g1~~TRINITY_DN72073_c0_g1_i1.p9  ORF type:complete len:200 (-),score=27.48 TRINITY_DN72073_c0_g1_i1:471-1070(-)
MTEEKNNKWEELEKAKDELSKAKVEVKDLKNINAKIVNDVLVVSKENGRLKSDYKRLEQTYKERAVEEEMQRNKLLEANMKFTATVKEYETQINWLETDLIRTKQNLAEALNTIHELEADGLLEYKMTFKELSPRQFLYQIAFLMHYYYPLLGIVQIHTRVKLNNQITFIAKYRNDEQSKGRQADAPTEGEENAGIRTC